MRHLSQHILSCDACPSIKQSTQSPPQRIANNIRERLLRSQGPRSRHQIRRTPTTSSLPPAGTSLKSQNRTWGPSPLSKGSMVARFQELEDETYVLVLG